MVLLNPIAQASSLDTSDCGARTQAEELGAHFLRRAARVAILVPLMSRFTSDVIKQAAVGLPSSFGLFSILVFVNLGDRGWLDSART